MKTKFVQSILAALVLAACSSAGAAENTVKHVVTEDETAWFLATVYYGKGQDYTKLLSANHLQRPEDMKEGMEIRIENPRFFKTQNGFSERYTKLWEQRQKALGLNTGSALPSSKVVIPAEKIRTRDNTPKLPFAEKKDLSKSAADLAREELLKNSRKSEKDE